MVAPIAVLYRARMSARPFYARKRFWSAFTLLGLLAVVLSIGLRRTVQEAAVTPPPTASPAAPVLSLHEPLAPPARSGELVVLSLPGPTTVLLENGEPQGYEADLAAAFARAQGWSVRFELFEREADLWAALRGGEGHLAAAGLTPREAAGAPGLRGPAYKNVQAQLVCRRTMPPVRTLHGLAGFEVLVVQDSHHEDRLAAARRDVPRLVWTSIDAPSALPLIDRVAAGEADCAVGDSNIIALARTRLVDLEVPMALSEDDQPLAWVVSPRFTELTASVADFIEAAHEDGTLEELDEWHVLDDMLPLLAEPTVYKGLRYGYARGDEPVGYVRRIRTYHETLAAEIAGVDGRPPLFLRRPHEG